MRFPLSALSKLSIIAAIAVTVSAPRTQPQEIRIRVINMNDSRPLPQQHVSLALGYGKGEKVPAEYDANPRLETDVSGEAKFRLPEPAPHLVVAQVHLTSEYWHCICLAMETTQDIIQKGFVQPAGRDSAATGTNEKPAPGVILFFARPFTFFERLLYPLMKE